jgi:16S rRNA (guanine966-N2)-methyltransferase
VSAYFSGREGGAVTRIVAGRFGGRRLVVPSGRDVRPTSDRAREAMFSALTSMLELAGSAVLDLYAGSGAVGLEALSRGAARAALVECEPRALAAVRANVAALDLAGTAAVLPTRVERLVAAPPAAGPYDLVFADPPYALADRDVDAVLGDLVTFGWLAAGAVVVIERPSRGGGPAWPESLRPAKQRRYGEGTLWYGRRT